MSNNAVIDLIDEARENRAQAVVFLMGDPHLEVALSRLKRLGVVLDELKAVVEKKEETEKDE